MASTFGPSRLAELAIRWNGHCEGVQGSMPVYIHLGEVQCVTLPQAAMGQPQAANGSATGGHGSATGGQWVSHRRPWASHSRPICMHPNFLKNGCQT